MSNSHALTPSSRTRRKAINHCSKNKSGDSKVDGLESNIFHVLGKISRIEVYLFSLVLYIFYTVFRQLTIFFLVHCKMFIEKVNSKGTE